MSQKIAAAVAALLAGALGAAAQESDPNTIVVTASRVEREVPRLGVTSRVIDSNMIDRAHAPAVNELLNLEPGVAAVRTGAPGSASGIFLRGANRNHTLVLMDGVRLNDNASGGFSLEDLPTDWMERVEIVPGAQSALYGSDAIGGVVNFIPRRGRPGDRPHVTVSSEAGNYEHRRASAAVDGGNAAGDYRVSASYWDLGGFDLYNGAGAKGPDGYTRWTAGGVGGLNLDGDGRVDLTALYTHGRIDLDGYQADDPDRYQVNRSTCTSARYQAPWTPSLRQTLQAGYNFTEMEGRDNGQREFLFNTRNLSALAQSEWTIDDATTLAGGYQFEARTARNEGNYDREHQYVHAVFTEAAHTRGPVTLNLGGRYDHVSDFDGEATWRGAASVQVVEGLRAHASAGTGFKAPSLNDLYWPVTDWSAGNPNLDPERSFTYDAGLEQALFERHIILDATWFASRVDDLINWASADGMLWKPENVDKAVIQGVELSATWKPVDDLAARLFYTRTDARDDRTDHWLPRRARDRAGAQLEAEVLKKGTVQVEYLYVGRRYDDTDNKVGLSSYGLVNLAASWAFTPAWSLYGRVDNVLDVDYEEAAGYGTLGCYGYLGVQYSY